MRKSSFGQFGGRLSTGPLRVRNDGGNGSRKSTVSSHTPQGKSSSQQSKSALSSFRNAGRNSAGSSGIGNRTSGIGVRSSGIGVRGSGIGARGRTDVPKDPRPISDRSFQHKCIRMLIDFLTENKYPHAISPKVLQSPSSREFFRIFEFIYSHLVPGFKLTGKMEEEVLRVLKSLGYPFTISKSYMYSVGSPHSWPYLLAALIWMVDLVKYSQSLANSPILDQYILFPNDDEDFDSLPLDRILFEYSSQTYRAYLNGEDTYEAFDDELSKVLEGIFLGQSGGIGAVRAENARIAEEIGLQEQELERVRKLQEQQQIMLLDERKFHDYLGEVEGVIRKHQQMLSEAGDQQASLTAELKSIQAKLQHMQAIYEQQEMTPADVERLRAARQELQRQEESLEREVEAIDTEIWKKEMAIARLREQVDGSISEYSKLARSLKLIPASAENAQGIDFEWNTNPQEMHNNNFENTIKPALVMMRKQSMEELHQSEAAKLQKERNMDEFMENISDMQQELAQLDKDIRTADEELECRKQLYQRDTDGLQSAIDQLQQEIRSLQTSSQMSLQDAERDLRETYSWAEQQKIELARQEQEWVNFMVNACTQISNHKTCLQERLKELEKDMKQVLAQTQQVSQLIEENSRALRESCASDL